MNVTHLQQHGLLFEVELAVPQGEFTDDRH